MNPATNEPVTGQVLVETGQLLKSLERTLAELADFTAHLRLEVDTEREQRA